VVTSIRIATARWRRYVAIALIALALAMPIAALALQAWATLSTRSDARARQPPIEAFINRLGGEP